MARQDVYHRGTFLSAFGGAMGCIFGIVFTIGIIGVGCFLLVGRGVNHIQEASEERNKKERQEAESAAKPIHEWSPLEEVRMRIDSVSVERPATVDRFGKKGEVSEPLLVVRITVENISKTKKLNYSHPKRKLFESGPSAIDEHGNKYPLRDSDLFQFEGAAKDIESLNPGDAINDVICFDPPIKAAAVIRLSLESPSSSLKKHEFRFTSSDWSHAE